MRCFWQSIGLYLSVILRLFTIHTISELSTFKRSRSQVLSLLLQDNDSIYLPLQGNTRLNYANPRLTLLIGDLLNHKLFPVNLILKAYTRTQAVFVAWMAHHATSPDVPAQTRTHDFPGEFLIELFQTIIDFLYHEYSYYKSDNYAEAKCSHQISK